jgi:hypothetical protein
MAPLPPGALFEGSGVTARTTLCGTGFGLVEALVTADAAGTSGTALASVLVDEAGGAVCWFTLGRGTTMRRTA